MNFWKNTDLHTTVYVVIDGCFDHVTRVSSDLKSRETAMLEAHYSDSKIQLLQQELATVNNSLQAYQDER